MEEIHIRNVVHKNGRASIISVACGFESRVIIVVNGQKFNAKSIMNASVVDNAENIDFMIMGADEENVKIAIKKFYGLI